MIVEISRIKTTTTHSQNLDGENLFENFLNPLQQASNDEVFRSVHQANTQYEWDESVVSAFCIKIYFTYMAVIVYLGIFENRS